MKRLIVAVSILSIVGTSSVLAQGMPHYTQGKPQHSTQNQGKHYRPNSPKPGKPDFRRPQPPRYSQWSKGRPLPPQYRRNVVRDYHRYHLSPPPRGYQWVRVNNEYVLIGIASGIISSILMAQ